MQRSIFTTAANIATIYMELQGKVRADSYPILFRIIVWIVFPVAISVLIAYRFLLHSLPTTDGVVKVRGLRSTVTIIRDGYAVPHIVASSDYDAFYAMGYVHAQDRLWQMEYQRRLGQGRLSEVFGSDTLVSDQYMRTLGLYSAAKASLAHLDERAISSLEAYSRGVNAWLDGNNELPPEFHLLNFEPEFWRPEDSLLQIKLMAQNLGFNHRQELTFDLLVNHLGVVKASQLMLDYPSEAVTVTEASNLLDPAIRNGLLTHDDRMRHELRVGGEGIGSNGWVVSGAHTQTGMPLLANDPHLSMEIPSSWYLAEIKGDRLHVSGATYPGLPMVILGHNQAIAWGGTALGADVQDLYLERTNPANEDQYEVEGEWRPMDIDEEWIIVKPDFPSALTDPIPPLKWEVRRTRHGPLITDVLNKTGYPLALRWTALEEEDKSYQSLLDINYASNWQEFRSALVSYVAPTLNFLYADAHGNIAYIAGGKVPKRRNGDGRLPVPGWESKHEWDGYVPFDELPQSLNPESGFIVSANNKNHDDDYPHLISTNWAPPYRAQRIEQVIRAAVASGKKLSVGDFARLQGDLMSLQAAELLPFIGSLSAHTAHLESALATLREWDGTMAEDSVAAALYESWFRHFNRSLLNDDLRGDLLHPERLDRLLVFAEQLNPVFVNDVIVNSGGKNTFDWCDQILTADHETCEAIALRALDKATEELFSITGDQKTWGDIHPVRLKHRGFSNMQLLGSIFDRTARSPGSGFSVNVGSWLYSKDEGYEQVVGATYRQVIDLADWNNSGFINNTGQSGNILSHHYDDNISRHHQQVLLPMHFGNPSALSNDAVLRLQPAGGEATGAAAVD
jgi:penicillin amidase